jgi:hypothetical protein
MATRAREPERDKHSPRRLLRSSSGEIGGRRFSSVSVSQQRFRYSQSTSVCFSFVLQRFFLLLKDY